MVTWLFHMLQYLIEFFIVDEKWQIITTVKLFLKVKALASV